MGGEDELLHARNALTQEIKGYGSWVSQYQVKVDRILADETPLNYDMERIGKNNLFFDSGTTITYFEQTLYDAVVGLLREKQKTVVLEGNCFTVSSENDLNQKLSQFPVLNFYFGNSLYQWHPRDYFTNDDIDSQYCLTIEKYHQNILGGTFMRNYNI